MNLEQSLQSLREDEAATRVPPQVDAAVMAAWDARARQRSADERAVRHGHRRMAIAWAIGGAIAASLLTVAILWRPRAGDATPRPFHGAATEKPIAPASSPAIADTFEPPVQPEQPTLPKRMRPPAAPRQADLLARRSLGEGGKVGLYDRRGAGYVLVPDGGMDAPLTMMRVRMSRSAFSQLGVPIANPDGDGMVDVDVLVGEDGVARSIRRASAVGPGDARR